MEPADPAESGAKTRASSSRSLCRSHRQDGQPDPTTSGATHPAIAPDAGRDTVSDLGTDLFHHVQAADRRGPPAARADGKGKRSTTRQLRRTRIALRAR